MISFLPVGIGFDPSDQELLSYYLWRKVCQADVKSTKPASMRMNRSLIFRVLYSLHHMWALDVEFPFRILDVKVNGSMKLNNLLQII